MERMGVVGGVAVGDEWWHGGGMAEGFEVVWGSERGK